MEAKVKAQLFQKHEITFLDFSEPFSLVNGLSMSTELSAIGGRRPPLAHESKSIQHFSAREALKYSIPET
ncbi:MAG: hypothetical protein NTZ94_05790 [Verrucomicrobia bacterium]|nr:hypothetical protein [Verrucomicrobiota bacterium]